jgi:hypothetical protein
LTASVVEIPSRIGYGARDHCVTCCPALRRPLRLIPGGEWVTGWPTTGETMDQKTPGWGDALVYLRRMEVAR